MQIKNAGKWIYNTGNEEHWGYEEVFETQEEAIQEGIKWFKENADWDDRKEFQVGVLKAPVFYFNYNTITDMIADEAYDIAGDSADGWIEQLESAFTDQKELLLNMMSQTFKSWMNITQNEPYFYGIESDEWVNIGDYYFQSEIQKWVELPV